MQSSYATATGTMSTFPAGPYEFRVAGDWSNVGYANLQVSHLLISNNSVNTWPTTEELNCTKQKSMTFLDTSSDTSIESRAPHD